MALIQGHTMPLTLGKSYTEATPVTVLKKWFGHQEKIVKVLWNHSQIYGSMKC